MKKSVKENIPGPGNYNTKPETSSSFRFGTEKREVKIKNDTPGPGQYRTRCTIADVPIYLRSSGGFQEKWKFI